MTGEKSQFLDIVEKQKLDFIHRLLFVIVSAVLIYSAVYFFVGAYLATAILLLTLLICTPLIIYLDHRGFHRSARFLGIASGTIYICATLVGIDLDLNIEYYLFPGMMISVLVFEEDQQIEIFLGFLIPIMGWMVAKYFAQFEVPAGWGPITLPVEVLRNFNFLGSGFITAVFLYQYSKYSIGLRSVIAQEFAFEQERQAKMAISSKFATIGEMAGGIAHEINNPVTIIIGKVRQIDRLVMESDLNADRIREELIKIRETSQRISQIVSALRLLGRNDDQEPRVMTSLSDLVDASLSLCKERFGLAGIQLRLNVKPQVKLECKAPHIGQVMLSLLNNAYDAINKLRNSWVEVSLTEKSDRIVFSVTDCGDGISMELVERIMNPFFTTKDIGQGAGLGLSTALGIARDHGGILYYDTTAKNTRFVLELPRDPNVNLVANTIKLD